jgi:hypothetical protein
MKDKSTDKKDPNQFDRFLETARKLECDEDKERFEAKLGAIVKSAPPRPAVKKRRVK